MFGSISNINPKDKNLRNMAMLPGFNYTLEPIKISEKLSITNNIVSDIGVVDEKIFAKFFGFINETNNNSTRKRKNKKKQPTLNKTKSKKHKHI